MGKKPKRVMICNDCPVLFPAKYADDIGADVYAPEGPSAARKAKEAIGT